MFHRWLLSSVAVLTLAACAPEPAGEAPASDAEARLDDIAVTPAASSIEYATSIQFLPLEPANTRGLVLELANAATPEGLTHRYSGWHLTRGGWRTILAIELLEEPTRAPWRVFPTDSLRITVSADGDPEALILESGGDENTLELGERLDTWEDRVGVRHVIRQAVWSRRGERVNGMMTEHRVVLPEPERPARFGPFERAIVSSGDGTILVIFNTRESDVFGDPYAWMYADGLTRRWTAVETRTVEVANSSRLRRNVPIRTWFRIPEPDIRGELTAAEREFYELSTDGGPQPYTGLYRVRGWIEFAGERRTVEGVMERAEP